MFIPAIGYGAYALFTYEPRRDRFEELVEVQAPADQKVFLEIVGRSAATADEAANDAAEAKAYIDGNRELCAETAYNPFDEKVGWVGFFDEADLTDSNSKMYVEIEIGFGNEIRSEVPTDFRDTVLAMKARQAVSFSGSFRSGNMNENQCLRTTWSMLTGSTPKLTYRVFSFDLQKIALIAE